MECMYGGPDMYDSTLRQRTVIDKNGDTLQITGKDTIVKQKAPMDEVEERTPQPVMYGGPYSRYNTEEKSLVK